MFTDLVGYTINLLTPTKSPKTTEYAGIAAPVITAAIQPINISNHSGLLIFITSNTAFTLLTTGAVSIPLKININTETKTSEKILLLLSRVLHCILLYLQNH